MRKFYSLLSVVALSMVSLTASADTWNVPEENEVLQSEQYNMRLYKNVDFEGKKINGVEIDGDITFDTSITTDDFKYNAYSPFRCTTEGLSALWQSVGNIAWASGYGLRNTGSGPRGLHLTGLKQGQILVMQGRNGGYNTAESNAEYNGFCIPNGFRYSSNTGWAWEYTDPIIVEDISDEIHAAQDAIAAENGNNEEVGGGDEGESTPAHDKFLYLRVIADGTLNFPLERSASILGFQIWIDANAAEAVTTPSVKVVGVNGADRDLEFKPGESTFGNTVYTYYSTDGSDPIYMKDSEEIDHYEYIYLTDGDGNLILDPTTEMPIVMQETPVYKRVFDEDAKDRYGDYGDVMYDGSGSITIYGSMDEDGDGYVIVKAASVSESGMVSDIMETKIAVGDITLNAPALILQGFDGTSRSYMLDWSNNTICGEEFSFIVEGTGADADLYAEDIVVGDIINISDGVKVTVKVEGYTDGVLDFEADNKGLDIHRKATVIDDGEGNTIHDWDFTKLTLEQQAIVKGEVIESYYVFVDGDSIVCSYEDYIANDGLVGGIDFTEGTPNYAPTCWWWDAGKTRATLNVDTLVATTHNRNSHGYGYVEDFANIFPGMCIDCAPNNSNNSCIFIYINGDLGAYFMTRPSITFPRSSVAAGEFLLLYTGAGGSNWTNVRGPEIFQAPTDELLKVSGLRFAGGTHIFYMDVYTYNELPTDELEDAEDVYHELVTVENVEAEAGAPVAYYTIGGSKFSTPQKGFNIVKYANGNVKKIFVW